MKNKILRVFMFYNYFSISSGSFADQKMVDDVKAKIATHNEQGALDSAKKLDGYVRQIALIAIVNTAKNLRIRESAADAMRMYFPKNIAYSNIVRAKLAQKNVEGALSTARKITTFYTRDCELRQIFNSSKELSLREKVAPHFSDSYLRQKAFRIVAKAKAALANNPPPAIKKDPVTSPEVKKDAVTPPAVRKASVLELASFGLLAAIVTYGVAINLMNNKQFIDLASAGSNYLSSALLKRFV